jgi:hypothetical protein
MAHGQYNVEPGTLGTSLHLEIAAELPRALSNSEDADPWPD